MRRKGTLGLLWILLLTIPAMALAADSEADTIAALEARVEALEAQIEEILAALEEPPEPEVETIAMGQAVTLADGNTIAITEFATGTQFRYTPAGRFASQTLSAKSGYSLLCLFVTVENTSGADMSTEELLSATLYYGSNHENKAQNSFFYQTAFGSYTDGLKTIGPGASVNGCLLFVVPDDVETSRERIAVQFTYADVAYECVVRL